MAQSSSLPSIRGIMFAGNWNILKVISGLSSALAGKISSSKTQSRILVRSVETPSFNRFFNTEALTLILRRPLDMVDDKHSHRPFGRLQLQAKLLLNRRIDRRRSRVRRRRIAVRILHPDVVEPWQPRLVLNDVACRP